MLYTLEAFARLCRTLIEDSFEQNLVVRSLLGLSFKPRRLALKKDAVPTIRNVTVIHCKPEIGQTNDAKQANNALRTTGKLLDRFPSKRRFVFRSKTFPTIESLTRNRPFLRFGHMVQCNMHCFGSPTVQLAHRLDNTSVSKHSLSFIPSIKLRGHFGNVSVKPSAGLRTLN